MKMEAARIEKRDGVAVLTFEAFSLSRQLGHDLTAAVRALTHDEDVGAIVITGSKNVFLSGVDLREIRRLNSSATANRVLEVSRLAALELIECPKPTVAAINGFCLGAGAEIALSCDLRVAVEATQNMAGETVPFLGFLHVQRGMVPHLGGTQLLPRLVGPARAKDLLLTARLLTGAEALRLGLVNRLAPPEELLDAAFELARAMSRNHPEVVRLLKELIHRSLTVQSVEEGLRLEREAFARCCELPGAQDRPFRVPQGFFAG